MPSSNHMADPKRHQSIEKQPLFKTLIPFLFLFLGLVSAIIFGAQYFLASDSHSKDDQSTRREAAQPKSPPSVQKPPTIELEDKESSEKTIIEKKYAKKPAPKDQTKSAQSTSDLLHEKVQGLIAKLADSKPKVALTASIALSKLGKAAVPQLRKSLEDPKARLYAAHALSLIGKGAKAAIPDLIAALEQDHRDLRNIVSMALSTIAKNEIKQLSEALHQRNVEVKVHVAYALSLIGKEAHKAIPDLISALENSETELGFMASYALGKIGAKAVPDLSAALRHTEDKVQIHAAYALSLIGKEAHEAIPNLITILESSDSELQFAASVALGKIGKNAIPELVLALSHSEPATRLNAVRSLGIMRQDAFETISALKQLKNDSNSEVTKAVEIALRLILKPDSLSNPSSFGLREGKQFTALEERESSLESSVYTTVCKVKIQDPMPGGAAIEIGD
ncbi:MAG: HEAT repeat domain-containing protein [Planctomycetota bacterium]|nr:HEAT repeat domain-containing protein [Planctomycetota bacterium]